MTMKKIFTLLIGALLFSGINAQMILPAEKPQSKFKIKNFSFAVGGAEDMLYGLSQDQMLSMVRGELEYDYPSIGFTEKDVATMVCENPYLTASIGIQPRNWNNGFLELSVMAVWDRLDGVNYYQQFESEGQRYYNSINLDAKSNEVNVGLAYIHHMKALNTFGVRFGLGSNVGYSFGNTMRVSGQHAFPNGTETEQEYTYNYFDEYYDLRNSIYGRAFAEAGLDLTFFKKVTIGWVYRYGYGLRSTPGNGELDPMRSQSLRLFASYNL